MYFNKTNLIAKREIKNTDNPSEAFEIHQPFANNKIGIQPVADA